MAACFATWIAACIGVMLTVASIRTRSVMVAAPASSVIISWLGYAIRSPAPSTENGPASIARIHAIASDRVSPSTIDGNAIPIFMRTPASAGVTC